MAYSTGTLTNKYTFKMTGYGDRFIGGFQNPLGETINVRIMQKNYAGAASSIILRAESPVIISKPNGDLLTNIFGTGCKINIVNTGDFLQYNELFGTPEREHYVVITKTGSTKTIKLFEGFVLPQMYEQSLSRNAIITIPANDQLSTLENKKPSALVTESYFVKLIDLVKEIVWSTGIDLPIHIKNGIYNTTYTASWNAAITPFDQTYVDKNLFLEDGEPKDSRTVLETILKSFGSRLYYMDGGWYIDRLKDHTGITTYKVYNKDGTTSTAFIPHQIIELSSHYLVNGSGYVQYEAGIKEYELTLNLDVFSNMVNPNFSKVKVGTTQEMFTIYTDKMRFTFPTKYEWLDNNGAILPTSSGAITYHNKNYKDGNIVQGGIDWNAFDNGYWDTPARWTNLSTMITVDYDTTAVINVKFNVSLVGHTIKTDKAYRVRYALRYSVPGATYKFKWLYFNGSGDLAIESSLLNYSNTYFSTIKEGSDILGSENPTIIQINDSIPIGEIIQTIKADISPTQDIAFIELFLDTFLLEQANIIGGGTFGEFYPMRTKMGDFAVTSSVSMEDNIINAQIAQDFNTKMNLELDLFNYNSTTVKNTAILKNGSIYVNAGRWKETGYSSSRTLQMMYLADIVQNYSNNRYKLSVDVRIGIENAINLNNLFTYQHLVRGNEDISMVCVGYDLNVKNNTYRLSLQEWVADDGYYIVDYLADDSTFLTINPTSKTVSGLGESFLIDVTANGRWEVINLFSWVGIQPMEGFGNNVITVYVPENFTGYQRIGNFTVRNIAANINNNFTVTQNA